MPRTVYIVGALLVTTAVSAANFQIGVREDGVYRVSYDEIAAAGLAGPAPSDFLSLSVRGEAVSAWIDDGGDGQFGPGDSFEFEGTHAPGEHGYYSEHTPWNVYRLVVGNQVAARPVVKVRRRDWATGRAEARVQWRKEADRIRVRFNAQRTSEGSDVWYWQRLSVLDRQPFQVDLPRAVAFLPAGSVTLRVGLKGWSTPRDNGDLADHRVELLAAGEVIGAGEWSGQDDKIIELTDLTWPGSDPRLYLRVPQRKKPEGDDALIDVSLLNWVELDYPYDRQLGNQQLRIELAEAGDLPLPGDAPVTLVGNGQRLIARSTINLAAGSWWMVPEAGMRKPEWVLADRPSNLASPARQADYLLIGHGSLLEAAEPLATFHRDRGLTVTVVDVQDVYDEFNHGIVSPRAIRDFVHHAYRRWTRPAPRFVLLVGDASWDTFNAQPEDRLYADWTYKPREKARFLKNASTPYQRTRYRNLIPTWFAPTYEGYAASDNAFVAVDGEDSKPDLAIGRLPVATPDEVTAIVEKIIDYANRAELGPWRRNTLWITNEQLVFQQRTDRLLASSVLSGFDAHRVYPSADEADNVHHQQSILNAFDRGSALVHFIGHGGRYIWRTGPPDPRKNHDLFTLDHLDQLQPTRQLPVVLSMTCYSAPFDHPTADSIGEKLLRLPGRGAIAVLAASWRNFPAATFSRYLIEELMTVDTTIGEAVMRAKRRAQNRLLVETYNLLGDPALSMAIPRGRLMLHRVDRRVVGRVTDGPMSGRAMVDYLDPEGDVLASREVPMREGTFEFGIPSALAADVQSVRAYVWNAAEGYDAVAAVDVRG